MPTYYFVGGPLPARASEFFRRLAELGGPPPGWRLYPHASGDGKALHIIRADSDATITAHLSHFADIYQASPPIEIVEVDSAVHSDQQSP